MGGEQRAAVHPILDQQREIEKKRQDIRAEIATLYARFDMLGAQHKELEQKRKDINRHYSELKQNFIMQHPKEETQRDTELARQAREKSETPTD